MNKCACCLEQYRIGLVAYDAILYAESQPEISEKIHLHNWCIEPYLKAHPALAIKAAT